MSFTVMASSNNLTVKRWEMETWVQALQKTAFGHMMERGIIFHPEELKGEEPGDSITFAYAGKLTKVPVGEGGTLDGNEEALALNNFSMKMNVSRCGVLNPNKETIEQKRTYVDFSETAKKLMSKRVAELVDTSTFYQLAGANPSTLTIGGTTYASAADMLHVTGHNVPTAPTTNRIIRAGNQSADENLGATNLMSTDLIDYALEAADLSIQPIEALDGEEFDLFCSPEQIVDLMHDTTGHIQWYINQLALLKGGKESKIEDRYMNGMVSIGRYRNVNIYQSPRVAFGVNSSTSAVITNARRAVLLGRDALALQSPFGSSFDDEDVPVKFFAQLKDYDYYKGLEGRLIYGAVKTAPSNKDDVGVVAISTYAASHSNVSNVQ
ncbi:MAG: DUF4043 family protein [Patescibacteria group bacterium]|nr:DUF4043 family protein [Patescibacteria group bacterium]